MQIQDAGRKPPKIQDLKRNEPFKRESADFQVALRQPLHWSAVTCLLPCKENGKCGGKKVRDTKL